MTTDAQKRERILFLKKVNTANVPASVYAFSFISQSHKRTLEKSMNPQTSFILKLHPKVCFSDALSPFSASAASVSRIWPSSAFIVSSEFLLKMPGNRDNVKTTCVLNVWKGSQVVCLLFLP